MLGGTADLAKYDLAFEWSKDYQPEVDYSSAGFALTILPSSSELKSLAIDIDDARAMTDQALSCL